MKKILLIQPRMQMRPMDTQLKTRMAPSLGLLTVAQTIRAGNNVTIVNENVDEQIDFAGDYDIVGITVTVDTLPAATEISAKFRNRGIPHQILAPAYDMIDRSKYMFVNVISASRGCPFKCEFCYNSCENIRGSFVNREVDSVIADIKQLGHRHVHFIDDNFIGNPQWTRKFLERIKPMKLKWNAAVSANVVELPGMLDLMKDSGCQGLFIGFESVNDASLETAHKGQNSVEKFDRLVNEIHRRGIMINASFVFGLDDDDPTTFRRTLEWIVDHKIETVTSHILTPYPGTAQYRRMASEGRVTTFDQRLYTTSNVVYKPMRMDAETLYKGYLAIYDDIYSFHNILRRMPKYQTAGYLCFNFAYRKYGKLTERICSRIGYNRIGKLIERISFRTGMI